MTAVFIQPGSQSRFPARKETEAFPVVSGNGTDVSNRGEVEGKHKKRRVNHLVDKKRSSTTRKSQYFLAISP